MHYTQHYTGGGMDKELQLRFTHEFTPEVRARLDAYVADENARLAPATLALRAVINAALDEYLTRRGYRMQETERVA